MYNKRSVVYPDAGEVMGVLFAKERNSHDMVHCFYADRLCG